VPGGHRVPPAPAKARRERAFLRFGARISNEQSTKYRFLSELFRNFLLLVENLF
jgi:hypothetical protein